VIIDRSDKELVAQWIAFLIYFVAMLVGTVFVKLSETNVETERFIILSLALSIPYLVVGRFIAWHWRRKRELGQVHDEPN